MASAGFYNEFNDQNPDNAEWMAMHAIEEAEANLNPQDEQIILSGGYDVIRADDAVPPFNDPNQSGQTNPCATDGLFHHAPDFQVAGVPGTTPTSLEGDMFHEFGHALDDMLGNLASDPSDFWSDSSDAREAIADDRLAMSPQTRASLSGLTPADIIANIYQAQNEVRLGNPTGPVGYVNVNAETFLSYFPNTNIAFTSVLTTARQQVNDGTFAGSRDCENIVTAGLSAIGILETQLAQPDETPLILELSNDAVHTTSLNDGIYFDMHNTGFDNLTAWVGANDGMLVLDTANDSGILSPNDTGVIQNGAQLFGNNTPLANGSLAPTGFAALAQYDTDNSGQINANDSVWSELKVEMGNGTIVSLNDLGITGINLAYNAVNVIDANGNNDAWNGSFVYGNGTTGTVADYILQQNTYESFASSQVQVSNAILALPDVQGSGTLNTLQQSMQLDNTGTLQGLVEQFVSTSDQATQNSLLSQIITNWTGSNSVANNAYGPDINGQIVASLEKIYGEAFEFSSVGGIGTQADPTALQSSLLEGIYLTQSESIYAQLEFGGAINDLATLMENGATWNSNGGGYTYDLSSVANAIILQDSTDHNDAQSRLTEFIRSLNGFNDVNLTNFQTFENDITTGASDLDSIFATNNSLVNPAYAQNGSTANYTNDVSAKNITVTGSNDTVELPNGDVIVNASGANTFVVGNLGNDTITLGAGTTENVVQWAVGAAYTGALDSSTFVPGFAPGNDTVNLGTGINNVDSGFGNMIYNVSAGENDSLENGSFNDTYNLASGFGNVFVYSGNQPLNSAVETFNFGAGLAQNAMVASGSGLGFEDLTLSFGTNTLDLNEVLFGTDGFPNNQIFTFSDGNSYTLSQLLPNGVNDSLTGNNNAFTFTNAPLDINFSLTGSNDSLNLPLGGGDTVTLSGSNDVVSGVLGNDVVTDNGSNNLFNVSTGQGVIQIGTNDTITGAPSEIKLGGTSLQSNVTFAVSSGNIDGLTVTLPGSNTLNLSSILDTPGGGNTVLQFSDNSTTSLAQFLQNDTFNVSNTASNSSFQRINSFANENITNSGSNDIISLGTGNDVVTDSGNGNLIATGTGNSTINVGINDTVAYSSGHFNTYVNVDSGTTTLEYDDASVTNDNIYFGVGIAANSLTLTADGNNAILQIDNAGDQLAIVNGFNDHIGILHFSNGTSETYASLLQAGVAVSNTLNDSSISYANTIANENITNYGIGDTISLGNGNDSYVETNTANNVYGGNGNDTYTLNSSASGVTLNLGSGSNTVTDNGHDNTVYTQTSTAQINAGTNDTIVAGSGNAAINLGLNDSAYAGSGVVSFTYSENDGTANLTEGAVPLVDGTSDSLTFGAGITSSDLTATVNGNELTLAIADGATNDTVNIYQELNQGNDKVVNTFNFSDNSSLTLAQILNLPIVNSESNTSIYYNGSDSDQNYLNNGSNDTLVLSNGNDSYTDNGSSNQIYTGTGNTNNVTLNSVSQGDVVNLSTGQSTVSINSGSSGDSIYLGSGDATINDNGHDNVIVANAGNATVSTTANDSFYGSSGNANITLNQNDMVSTGGGVTTMSYAVNDGYSIIYEGVTPTTDGTSDVLNFGSGITADNISYQEYGDDLQLTMNDGQANDVLYLASELNQGSNKVIDTFNFADNSSLTLSQLLGDASSDEALAGGGRPMFAAASSNSTSNGANLAANSTPATATPTSVNLTPAIVSPTAFSSVPITNSSTSSDATPGATSNPSTTATPMSMSPASTDAPPSVVASTSSSSTPTVVSPASSDSTPTPTSSVPNPAGASSSPTPDAATIASISSTSSSPTPAAATSTSSQSAPIVVSSTPAEVSASPSEQTSPTTVAATTETQATSDASAAENVSTASTTATNVANMSQYRNEQTLGKHHLSAVKDAMSNFSDKSSGSHSSLKNSNNKRSAADHIRNSKSKDDADSAVSKADKYALHSGKFLTGADYALTVQNLASFAADKSEYSAAAAKHNNNHDLAQLAVGHH